MFDHFHFGVCYYPEHWPAPRHAADFRRIKEAGFDLVRMGEGAWSYFEPEEGKFQFDLFDRAIDLCRRLEIKVIFGTPTYCGPAWISHKYPEVLRWNFDRVPMKHGSRRNFNYTSGKYLDLSDRICTALAEHYAGEPQIIGWQLDNEFNCHMDVSYAPSDTQAFRQWLRKKYRTLADLNAAWGTAFWSQRYGDWEEIDLPHPTAAYQNPSALLDETRFISECIVQFARRQGQILRRHNKQWLVTHNGLFPNVNGRELAKELDFFSHDQYPLFFETWPQRTEGLAQARSLSMPFAVLEQQSGPGGQMAYLQRSPRPGEVRLWGWQSIAHGAKLLSFFRWRTCPYGSEQHWHGLVDQDNKKTRRLAEATLLGKEIRRVPAEFLEAVPMKMAAVLRDFDNEANERRIDTYVKSGEAEHARWLAGLARRHIAADYVWENSDFEGYSLLVAPHQKIVTPALAGKLAHFANAGGTLVLAAQSGLKDIRCHIVERTPPGLLSDLAGIEVEEWTALPGGETRGATLPLGQEIALSTFVERIRPTTAATIARWIPGDALLGDSPAITLNRFGKGMVFYIGGYCPDEAIAILVDHLREALDLRPIVAAGQQVEAVVRVGKRRTYVALLNHAATRQRVAGLAGSEDLLSGVAIDGDMVLDGFGVAIVRIARAKRQQT